ncbi:MAG: DUF1365 domain-containing protein [Alphaproteobacteria bacterium]|nr:DUF1365 domain-containing protein [Alphaproteobacteria bacterium]
MTAIPDATLYFGKVMHKRLKPVTHELTYSVFSVLVDPDRLPDMGRDLSLFGHNRWAPVSIHDRDYGHRDGSTIRSWVEASLSAQGIDLQGGPLRLLTFPRLWGYAFNPLSLHFCYDRDEVLRAILYEVSNTFGESHGYLIPVDGPGSDVVHQETRKVFHVSPFIGMDCRYRFAVRPPDGKLAVQIRQSDASDSPLLVARHTGRGRAMTDGAIATAIARHPLMTAKVFAGIHWEALRLWLKGARFHSKPPRPAQHVTR